MWRDVDYKKKRERLVESLKAQGYITSPPIEKAFLKVKRENFLQEEEKKAAYVDSPLPIPCSQTISAPSMIAIMLEVADLKRGLKVLEIGTGSGYNAALLAELVGEENVVSIERHKELASFGEENLRREGYKVKVVVGDGTLGYEKEMPYDRIIATAGAPRIPKPWIHQTKIGGKIIAPIGPGTFSQTLVIARKINDKEVEIKEDVACAFVPLIGEEGW